VRATLRAEFGNGEAFYAKEGKVITLPDRRGDQPNVDFLQWHMDTMFKAS
jgi:putative restriction endonuclease